MPEPFDYYLFKKLSIRKYVNEFVSLLSWALYHNSEEIGLVSFSCASSQCVASFFGFLNIVIGINHNTHK